MVANNPINSWDYLGLNSWEPYGPFNMDDNSGAEGSGSPGILLHTWTYDTTHRAFNRSNFREVETEWTPASGVDKAIFAALKGVVAERFLSKLPLKGKGASAGGAVSAAATEFCEMHYKMRFYLTDFTPWYGTVNTYLTWTGVKTVSTKTGSGPTETGMWRMDRKESIMINGKPTLESDWYFWWGEKEKPKENEFGN